MSENNRREFINFVLGGGAVLVTGSVMYPVVQFMTPPEVSEAETSSVMAGTISEIAPGSTKTFRFGSKPGLLIRTATGEFRAFIAICTHLGCIVQYNEERKGIWCACHGGLFDDYGNVVSGPPPKPLVPLKISEKNGEIFVSKAE